MGVNPWSNVYDTRRIGGLEKRLPLLPLVLDDTRRIGGLEKRRQRGTSAHRDTRRIGGLEIHQATRAR